ncbi:MAG: lasso peptide biosynthesis B2 protein [Trueperaceae bacterium]
MCHAVSSIGRIPPLQLLTLRQEDRRLLLRVLPVILFVRLALWLVPLSRLHRALTKRRIETRPLTSYRARRLAWAVTAVSSRVPSATCLTRALALQVLLRQRGSPSEVHVGMASTSRGDVQGHAWLEWQQEVLIGGGELLAFKSMVTLRGGTGGHGHD